MPDAPAEFSADVADAAHVGYGTVPPLAHAVPVAPPLDASTPALRAAQTPTLTRDRSRIYSMHDEGVTPAVLLTTTEGGPLFRNLPASMNTMELVISPEGRVEQVKLLTPAMRMTDMLLLSGAKTWKFLPALKDGEAVRYRTMFSWESTP
jgi:hypothetical protein